MLLSPCLGESVSSDLQHLYVALDNASACAMPFNPLVSTLALQCKQQMQYSVTSTFNSLGCNVHHSLLPCCRRPDSSGGCTISSEGDCDAVPAARQASHCGLTPAAVHDRVPHPHQSRGSRHLRCGQAEGRCPDAVWRVCCWGLSRQGCCSAQGCFRAH